MSQLRTWAAALCFRCMRPKTYCQKYGCAPRGRHRNTGRHQAGRGRRLVGKQQAGLGRHRRPTRLVGPVMAALLMALAGLIAAASLARPEAQAAPELDDVVLRAGPVEQIRPCGALDVERPLIRPPVRIVPATMEES